jgi:hypothetical protein
MPKFFKFALSVKCPRCRCGAGHWCREQGKCVPPHRERAHEALRITCSVLRPSTKTQVNPQVETRWEAGK